MIQTKHGYVAKLYFYHNNDPIKTQTFIVYFSNNWGYTAGQFGKESKYIFPTRLQARLAIARILRRNKMFPTAFKNMTIGIENIRERMEK